MLSSLKSIVRWFIEKPLGIVLVAGVASYFASLNLDKASASYIGATIGQISGILLAFVLTAVVIMIISTRKSSETSQERHDAVRSVICSHVKTALLYLYAVIAALVVVFVSEEGSYLGTALVTGLFAAGGVDMLRAGMEAGRLSRVE